MSILFLKNYNNFHLLYIDNVVFILYNIIVLRIERGGKSGKKANKYRCNSDTTITCL